METAEYVRNEEEALEMNGKFSVGKQVRRVAGSEQSEWKEVTYSLT